MTTSIPPRWLEVALHALLDARDQDTIAGDLFEEYTQVQLVNSGALRANAWYVRQLLSFVSVRIRKGTTVKKVLLLTSAFAVAAGLWLAVMENLLKHNGYPARTVMDAGITLQAVATLVLLIINVPVVIRYLVSAGGVGMLLLGATSIANMLHRPHFEGFVVVIGAALIVEGVLTPIVLLRFTTPGRE